MQFATLKTGEILSVETPNGVLSLIALDGGEVNVRALYEGDGSTRRPRLVSFPGRNAPALQGGAEAVTFEPNPNA